MSKTKELIGNYRKRRAEQAPNNIDGAVVERVESFKFLGVHITSKLSWSKHTKTVVKRARQNLFPLGRLKDFAWVPRSSKGCTAAPSRASCPVASPPDMATARHPIVRRYRGYCVRPSTSLGPSFLASRTYILGGVRGWPKKLSKTPVIQVIDCILCYRTASGTGAPSLGAKGSSTASTPKP